METKACSLVLLLFQSPLLSFLWPLCEGEHLLSKTSMAVSVKAVCCCGMEIKLHRLLQAGSVSCTRIPFVVNLDPKRFFSSVSPFSSKLGGTQTINVCCARTVLYPHKCPVPIWSRTLGLFSKNYSNDGPDSVFRQTLPVSTCRPRTSLSAVVRKNLLQGSASWPGKITSKVYFEMLHCAVVVMPYNILLRSIWHTVYFIVLQLNHGGDAWCVIFVSVFFQ